MDPPEGVLESPSTIEGVAKDASREACAMLEDETPAGELPRIEEASVKTSLAEATGMSPLRARRASLAVHSARRPPDKLVLNSYIKLVK